MNILGIESSCDETAAAVVRNGREVLSNTISSQIAIHRPHGGVVPELASRHHLGNILCVIEEALEQADRPLDTIDGIAVTCGPGLVGALLVGVQAAKAIAFARQLPLVGVNHLEGHLCAPRLIRSAADSSRADYPESHLCLLVSGGHTLLLAVERFGSYRLLGQTRDDAAGEAFDKVAKLLGLPYPGGPEVEKWARQGDPEAIAFPRALPGRNELDFSFSGLKTAVANYVRKTPALTPIADSPLGEPEYRHSAKKEIADICASFQQAVVDVLVRKTLVAARQLNTKTIVATGGVLANREIRRALEHGTQARNIRLVVSPLAFCTDNAAMIAAAGTLRLRSGARDDFTLNARARWPLAGA